MYSTAAVGIITRKTRGTCETNRRTEQIGIIRANGRIRPMQHLCRYHCFVDQTINSRAGRGSHILLSCTFVFKSTRRVTLAWRNSMLLVSGHPCMIRREPVLLATTKKSPSYCLALCCMIPHIQGSRDSCFCVAWHQCHHQRSMNVILSLKLGAEHCPSAEGHHDKIIQTIPLFCVLVHIEI